MNTDVGSSGSWRDLGDRAVSRLLLLLIEAYRLGLSPLLGGHCRFEPSCSAYGEQAIQRYGAWRGARLALARILRCHPFRSGGVDPVP
jgi:putative membrane protein insertion efficiency factor